MAKTVLMNDDLGEVFMIDLDKKIAYKVSECNFTSETTPQGVTITAEGKNCWDEIVNKNDS